MISPPDTVCPANTFTPRRFAFESRPLRLEPRPFLCAMAASASDLGDADAGELLPVAGAPLVPALGLELEDAQLRPALVGHDLGRHGGLADRLGVELRLRAVARQQQRRQLDARADVVGQPLDE